MKDVFLSVLELSIFGSLLAIIVIGIRHMMYKRLRKGLFYALWIMVFLKFVIPVNFANPIDFLNINFGSVNLLEIEKINLPEDNKVFVNEFDNEYAYLNSETSTEETNHPFNLIFLATWSWIIGCISMILVMIISYWKNVRKFKLGILEDSDIVNLHIDNPKICVIRSNVDTPMVCGIIRPKIILPLKIKQFDEETLKYMLLHEQQHIKWKDGLVNIVVLMVVILHWFNPIVWISYLLFKKDVECFCDERVINDIGIESKCNYAEALLNCTINSRRFQPAYILSFGEKNTKQRISSILKTKKWSKLSIITSIMIIIVIVFLFATNGSNEDTRKNVAMENKTISVSDLGDFDSEYFMDKILSNDQEAVIKLIKQEEYDPNYRFEDGRVYFENALVFMNLEMAQILFESGVDPNIQTSTGETIDEIIKTSGSKAMKSLLKNYQ